MWYYENYKTPAGPVDDEEAIDLIRTGSINGKTLVWREGMDGWLAAEKTELARHLGTVAGLAAMGATVAPSTAAPLPPAIPPGAFSPASGALSRPPVGFKDPSSLANWVVGLMLLSVVIALPAIWSGTSQMELLRRISHGVQLAPGEADANDARESTFGLTQVGIFIVTVIFFARWIYVVALNVRHFGAQGLEFTPGWAVGYYFIPIFCLWKPYLAMKELWKASHVPGNWQGQATGGILGLWWTFWILSGVIGQIALRVTFAAKTVDDFMLSTGLSIASDVIDIPLGIIAILLVRELTAAQLRAARGVT